MNTSLYDQDYYTWLMETAYLLTEGRFSELDIPNLIDEIESMGKSQKRAIESYLKVLLLHLLKWQYQPDYRSGSWRGSIYNARKGIHKRLQESPSLKSYPQELLTECYEIARFNAHIETELPLETFPETPTFTIEQVLDENFWPTEEN
ncbi:MAG: DUF29 domain-containing protein [Symploca sp. SIO2G7]|nr:DUF29 domain-containing protein [Symploca sp. SIO2G7]